MEAFSALLALCEGNLPVTGGFPHKGPEMRHFDVHFDVILNNLWNKQPNYQWFPITKVINEALWYFLCFAPEQTID